MRQVRALLTGFLFAMLMASLVHAESPALATGVLAFSFISGIVLAYGYTKSERRGMAFMACGLATDDIEIDCDPLTGGVMATFYIANKEDIDDITIDVSNPMLATSVNITTTGKRFFTIDGQLQSLEPKFNMIKGKYVNQFEHELTFLVFKIDPATKEQILGMKDGNFVCIVRNNHTGATGNCKYEIYGGLAGLKAEIIERNPQDAENLGAFKITLKTQEYAREGKPPLTLFDTSSATTEAHVADLLVAVP